MPDPFTIGPNALSNDDVDVTRNDDDELVIVDKASGEPISIGPDGLSTDSLQTGEINAVRQVHAGDWDSDLQAEIDAASANGEREVVVYGSGEFAPTESVRLPDEFTLKINDSVRLVPPESNNLEIITVGQWEFRTLIRNDDPAGGNSDVTVVGGEISFENITDGNTYSNCPVLFDNCTRPEQHDITVTDVCYDYTSGQGTTQLGVGIFRSRNTRQERCVGRRVGYDAIAQRGGSETIRIIDCEAHDIPGTGIQATGLENESDPTDTASPTDVIFQGCYTTAQLTFHSYGAESVRYDDCNARRMALICDEDITDVSVTDCKTERLGLDISNGCAVEDVYIRNLRVTEPDWVDTAIWASVRNSATLESVRIESCYATVPNFVTLEGTSTIQKVDIIDCVHKSDGGVFIERQNGALVSEVDIRGCEIRGVDTVVGTGVESVSIRGSDIREVGTTISTDVVGTEVAGTGTDWGTFNGVFESFETGPAEFSWSGENNDPAWYADVNLIRARRVDEQSIYGQRSLLLEGSSEISSGNVSARHAMTEQGIEYIAWVRAESTDETYQFHIFCSDREKVQDGEAYLTAADFAAGEFQLSRRQPDGYAVLEGTTHEYSPSVWYGFGIGKTFGGELRGTLYDANMNELVSHTIDDDNHSRGGIGLRVLRANQDANTYFGAITQRLFG